jgi:hypothetical protein
VVAIGDAEIALNKLSTAAKKVQVADGAGNVQALAAVSAAQGRLLGWSFRSTDAATGVTITLYDGVSNAAPVLAAVTLNPGDPPESDRDWFGSQGIELATGIFVERVGGGTAKGTIFTGPA